MNDGHGEKFDFDVPVAVGRGDDLRRDFQAVSSRPGHGSSRFGLRVLGSGGGGNLEELR